MDFSTVDRKLASSNPSKPDINPNNPRYLSADEFITDIRLIFSNCVLFNGPDHPVTVMGKRLEATFDKQIKNLPPPAEEVSIRFISCNVSLNANLFFLSSAKASRTEKATHTAAHCSIPRTTDTICGYASCSPKEGAETIHDPACYSAE